MSRASRLTLRTGLALAAAAAAIAGLQWFLAGPRAAAPTPVPPTGRLAGPMGEGPGGRPSEPLPPLPPGGGLVHLAGATGGLDPALPRIEIGADGTVACSPQRATASGADVVIVLPVLDLAALSPAARSSLAAVVGRLIPARPVPPDRFRAVDWELPRSSLARLLAWIP